MAHEEDLEVEKIKLIEKILYTIQIQKVLKISEHASKISFSLSKKKTI